MKAAVKLKLFLAVVVLVIVGVPVGLTAVQLDHYTARVETTQFLDSDKGKVSKFIRVQPLSGWYLGVDSKGLLKLKVADSSVPYFAWARDGDRAIDLKQDDLICVTDSGYRSDWFSHYPIFVSYTQGPCV